MLFVQFTYIQFCPRQISSKMLLLANFNGTWLRIEHAMALKADISAYSGEVVNSTFTKKTGAILRMLYVLTLTLDKI